MGAFADSVRQNVEKKKEEVNANCYKIMGELFRQIVYSTPVLDGYLRNGWYTMPNASYSGTVGATPDKNATGSLLRIESLAQARLFYGKDGKATMTNNLHYAYQIEYLGWSRFKAPYGMVRINLLSVASKYKRG